MRGTNRSWTNRLGPLSGSLFAVLIGIGITMSEPGGAPDEPAKAVAESFIKGRDGTRVGIYLSLVAVFFLIWFVSYLREHLRATEGAHGWMSSVAFGGGLILAATLLASMAIRLSTRVISDYGGDVQVAKTLLVLDWDFAGVIGPPFGALVGATSIAGLQFRSLPRWLSLIGILLAAALGLSGFYGGSLVVVGTLWVLVLSLVLLGRGTEAPEPA